MAEVKFNYGTKAKFEALQVKDNDTLYFLTDTLQIFKGAVEYTKSCKLVSTLPASGQVQGVVYVRTSDFTLHVFNGTSYIQLNKATVTEIPASNAAMIMCRPPRLLPATLMPRLRALLAAKACLLPMLPTMRAC